jgi:pyruvate,orthophosphate dikinase
VAMSAYVYDFSQGNKDMADVLGGKGANLAEMTNLGLPVPPGFTINTAACQSFLESGWPPPTLMDEVLAHVRTVETRMGRRFGDHAEPLLLSVRSGAKFSMPGMMETILDLGLTDDNVDGLAKMAGDERFAWDSYRRLIQMFARTVRGLPPDPFDAALTARRTRAGAATDADLDADSLQHLVDDYKALYAQLTGEPFPQNPMEQLRQAIIAVFESWNTERARLYRRQEGIADNLGTAVNVMAMVYGNLGPTSGTGVAFTRDPATGAQGAYGDYLPNAQGEDVVAGVRNAMPLQALAELDPASYAELIDHMSTLERHYRDLCDIEFTIERGRLWMLQTRVGKRTAAAAFVIASDLVDEGLIDLDEALRRVGGRQLTQLMFARFDTDRTPPPLASGVAASPGAVTGRAVFDAHRAAHTQGPVILVRHETTPDDLPGMIAAVGILTSRGGKTSHAAVVARGMGKACVCGVEALEIDADARTATVGDVLIREGDSLSLDGLTGQVYAGALATTASPVVRYLEGELSPADDQLVAAVHRLLQQADSCRRLGVRANADTPDDAARARRFGAAGIGLCRTEHMFLGERRVLIERVILAADDAERQAALDALLPLQLADFVEIFTAMDGYPVIVRLLDPPLHEFLPALDELAVRVAEAQARGEDPGHDAVLLPAVRRLHEQNPMLGLRGVRLGLAVPGLYAMQVKAIALAARECARRGGDPRPEIMIPLVSTAAELATARAEAEKVLAEVSPGWRIPIGTMIEVPRAALTAGQIANVADFFSFGTNDLTQLTWGFSRDDVEASFFPEYLRRNILEFSPFETLDAAGVGELVRMALERGRGSKPDISAGVCGEHGGDPASVHFFHQAGLDYVSCSPFRVPVARLEAGRAALDQSTSVSDSR